MTTSTNLARAELRKAWAILDLAETRAMAFDGNVPPTRHMISDEDFDIMCRHFLKALAYVTPTKKRGETLKRVLRL